MVWAQWRNQFTRMETSGRAKKPPRACVDCGAALRTNGKRCLPCGSEVERKRHNRHVQERRKRKADREQAEAMVRLCDEMGPNV